MAIKLPQRTHLRVSHNVFRDTSVVALLCIIVSIHVCNCLIPPFVCKNNSLKRHVYSALNVFGMANFTITGKWSDKRMLPMSAFKNSFNQY
ncbi:hypothetical protein XELAEV_18043687mg [Xenopus laevis]|uniref:Uncharacterized protein n=1 Tax=Xenopus laevis TaxID=8355 RepID=A0A974BXF3_XENLA|nr:hypothetical protein XELAEV_18043687mg [Xenopus laevis]